MVSDKMRRKEKDIQLECEAQMRDIQSKLQQQIKCLDGRLEAQNLMVSEMQDFFKRRSEIELEYSQKLDRLTKNFMTRQKQEKREAGSAFSTYQCLQHILGITRKQSKDHSIVADVFSTSMNSRLADVVDDTKRIFFKCKDTAVSCHEEIVKVLNELQSDMKQYHVFNAQAKQAESKLMRAESMKQKLEQQATKGSKKLKQIEKTREKRQDKYSDAKLKALKARNMYLLSIDAANAATNKYFVDDLSLLMDSMDFGYHNAMQRSMLLYNSCLENLKLSHQTSIDCLVKCVQELDPNKDKQTFLTGNSALFSLPKKIEFQPHRGDEVSQVSAQKQVQDDLLVRFSQINNRLDTLKLENEEVWKSIETVDKSLIEMINQADYDLTELFKAENPQCKPTVTSEMKKRRLETEAFYFEKFQMYLRDGNLLARLQAKHATLKRALGEDVSRGADGHPARPPSLPPKPHRVQRRVGKTPIVGRPKVFGCHLEEYVEATGEAIPMILRSCIRAINLYGMHHEGVFRVSGLQAEINEIKAGFEKGEDPLSDVTDSTSINSIAGVLKSFFRELQEPLFPLTLFEQLIETSRIKKDEDAIEPVKELIHTLSPQRVIVMRYLFAFLNHIQQYSDENLMYPYNLAICFGPTLLPIPQDKDQVAYQNNVNDLIKLIIVNCDQIFPKDDPGPVYERILLDPGIAFIRQSEAKFVICLSKWSKAYREKSNNGGTKWPSYKIWLSHENIRVSTEKDERDRDEADGSEEQSDEENEIFEASASFDFEGRSERELSFKKGDTLILYNQVSHDWWEGAHDGKEGLIPDKYIHVKRDDVSTPSTPSGSLPNKNMAQSLLGEPSSPASKRDPKRRSVDSQLQTIHQVEEASEKSKSQPNLPQETEDVSASTLSLSHQLEGIGEECDSSKSSLEKVTEFSGDNITTYLEERPNPTPTAPPRPPVRQSSIDRVALRKSSGEFGSTEKLEADIDSALAEVMSGLQTLTGAPQNQSPATGTSEPKSPPPTRCTPDLVQDLPVVDINSGSEHTSPVGSFKEESVAASAADVFANSGGTVVRIKSNSLPRPQPSEPAPKLAAPAALATRELSSFKRSRSTSSTISQREGRPTAVTEPMVKSKPTVTGKAIQVRMPSIPRTEGEQTEPSITVSSPHSDTPPEKPASPVVPKTEPERPPPPPELSPTEPKKSETVKPETRPKPPPVKAKPKPPVLMPKPRK